MLTTGSRLRFLTEESVITFFLSSRTYAVNLLLPYFSRIPTSIIRFESKCYPVVELKLILY